MIQGADLLFQQLVHNAIDFLEAAIADFETRPKHSVINFYNALELLLKARLMREHWSLIVAKDAHWQKFLKGDFVSVSFEEACKRLDQIGNTAISNRARQNFDVIRQHRNRMVHFIHPENAATKNRSELETIAIEQLRAWSDLNTLLTIQWREHFEMFAGDLLRIERALHTYKTYLQAKFDARKEHIDGLIADGKTVRSCRACGFRALLCYDDSHNREDVRCLVCDAADYLLRLKCPDCGETGYASQGFGFRCEFDSCECEASEDELAGILHEGERSYDDLSSRPPANCSDCDGYHTVIAYDGGYLCVTCFAWSDHLAHCEWCSEASTGDMEDSYWKGCGVCEGQSGWDKDD